MHQTVVFSFPNDKLIFGSLGLPIDLGRHRSSAKAKANVEQCRVQAGALPEDGHRNTAGTFARL